MVILDLVNTLRTSSISRATAWASVCARSNQLGFQKPTMVPAYPHELGTEDQRGWTT